MNPGQLTNPITLTALGTYFLECNGPFGGGGIQITVVPS